MSSSAGKQRKKKRKRRGRLAKFNPFASHRSTLSFLSGLVLLGILATWVAQFSDYRHAMRKQTLSQAADYNDVLTAFRTLYTQHVVSAAKRHGLKIRHDFREHEGSIPLPATLTAELGDLIGSKDSGLKVRLYSEFPFPWREKSLDDFERRALEALQLDPLAPYFEFGQQSGVDNLRYATADIMRPACVGCHNSHPDSPKVDWKVGDVRGVLATSIPMRSQTTFAGFIGRNWLALVLTGLITWLVFFSLRRQQTQGAELTTINVRLRRQVSLSQQRTLEAREAQKLADVANEARGNFLANMSHELRTPLNGVVGMIQLLQDTQLQEEQIVQVETLSSSAESLLDVINDILDFSKIDANELNLEAVPIELNVLVQSTLAPLQALAAEKGLKIHTELDDNLPAAILADPARLRQVLLNLVANAIKFTAQGVVTLKLQRQSTNHHHVSLHFRVEDTGIGIESTKLEGIFKPFTQADESTTRNFGGTGLGLAICSRLIALMGGKLEVESQLGLGSQFFFTAQFPITDRPTRTEEDTTATLAAGLRVLVVDDNRVNRMVATRLLEKLDCLVQIAEHGEQAVARWMENDFDVILMDCQMPYMDGYEATARIRDLSNGKQHVWVIALTASAMVEDKERCLASGMDDYLSKPLRPGALAKALRRAVVGT